MKELDLLRNKAKAVYQYRSILKRNDDEGKEVSAEDDENLDKLSALIDQINEELKALKGGESAEPAPDEASRDDEEEKKDEDEGSRRAPRMSFENRAFNGNEARYAKAFRNWMRTGIQHRDLSLGTNSAGGYMVTPTQMSKDFIVALNNLVFVRELADIEPVNDAKSLGVAKITADVSDSDWTSEVPSLTADSSLTFDRRDLSPNLLCKLVLASHRLLQTSSNPEAVIMQRLAYKNAVAEEKAYLTGNGSGCPLGMYYASSNGISTGRDVTAAAATSFTADNLISTLYKIPQQYQKSKSFGWILHRDTVSRARQLKDGNGSYIWQMGISADRPDTLLGVPVYQSEYAPNTFTTGLYVALVGDLKFYKIAEVATNEVQRLVERYADTNQIGFLQRRYIDASPVLETAFARLKLA